MSICDRLIDAIGLEPLEEIYNAVQGVFPECAAFFVQHNMKRRGVLTSMRRDTCEAKILNVCQRYPHLFPSVEPNRRRNYDFVLVQTANILLTSMITPSRKTIPPPSKYRDGLLLAPQLFGPKPVSERPVEAILLIVAGRFLVKHVNDRPRDMVIKIRDGERGYLGEELSLDALFAKPKIYQVPAAMPKLRKTPVQKIIVPDNQLVSLKDKSKRDKGRAQ